MRLIDGDALIKIINGLSSPALIMNGFRECADKRTVEEIVKMIEHMPTIEPERKKGRWIFWSDDPDANTYECSECHEPYMLIEGTPQDNKYHFCPNCGAAMRGEQYESD